MVSKSYDVLGRFVHFAGHRFSSLIVEFIGTFFLVFTIGINSVDSNPMTQTNPIAIGSILMVMIFMGGHISGAHYNPAVTVGVRLTGRAHISTLNAFLYVCIQTLAGIVAALVVYGFTDKTFSPPPPNMHPGKAFGAELLWTFGLVSVMLNCATTKSQSMNSFFGLAIGFTVLSGAYTVGSISGGCFNPAVATGPILIDATIGKNSVGKYIWIYWFAPVLGGALASVVFRITNTSEYRAEAAIADISRKDLGYQHLQDTTDV
eukprot:TRINITY_DN1996_c0_g3_i1.p1 TRINITY_DN1996_c0_g3~~TRINITY_DN1996_c0_g3_i1.p1  ORF type:complete len:262 (-),score=19.69 TRINITY_DN1996_c0_g3_i1:70-855(-)